MLKTLDKTPLGRYDVVGKIIEYESGMLGKQEALELFQHLVDTGMAWTLQGSYGRLAEALLEQGMIRPAA